MYQFTTTTGSTYTVENGRITREGDAILNDPTLAIVRERVRFPHGAPTPGERCRVILPDTEAGGITTSPVVSVTYANGIEWTVSPLPDVRHLRRPVRLPVGPRPRRRHRPAARPPVRLGGSAMSRTTGHTIARYYGHKLHLGWMADRRDFRQGADHLADAYDDLWSNDEPVEPTAPTPVVFSFDPWADVDLADLAERIAYDRAEAIRAERYDLDFDAECGWAAPTVLVGSDWHDNSVYDPDLWD